jgi:hypothetical protein
MLVDVDHPDEPLEVEVEQCSQKLLLLAVPNTSVQFEMWRYNADSPFEGSLGGRYYIFDPSTIVKMKVRTKVRSK